MICPYIGNNAPDNLWDEFHSYLQGINSFKKFFHDYTFITNHRQALNDYFKRFASPTIDNDYLLNRLKVGIQLEKYDVDSILFSSTYGNLYSHLLDYINTTITGTNQVIFIITSYIKIVFLDLTLILYAYFFMKDKKISDSKKELERLSRAYRL